MSTGDSMKDKVKKLLNELLEHGFFNDWKTSADVIKKLSQRGLTLKGRQVGEVNTTLTKMCQDSNTGLERDEIPKSDRKDQGKWKYKKMR